MYVQLWQGKTRSQRSLSLLELRVVDGSRVKFVDGKRDQDHGIDQRRVVGRGKKAILSISNALWTRSLDVVAEGRPGYGPSAFSTGKSTSSSLLGLLVHRRWLGDILHSARIGLKQASNYVGARQIRDRQRQKLSSGDLSAHTDAGRDREGR